MYTTLFRSEASLPIRMNLASLVLRLSLAVIFLYHGLDKIITHDGGTDWVNQIYLRMPEMPSSKAESERVMPPQAPTSLAFMGTELAVAWGEFLGGLALVAGLLTRLAALGMIVIQAGAVILVTAPHRFALRGGGYEYEFNLALIVMCLSLIFLGAGKWSVDWLLTQRRTKRTTTVLVPSQRVEVPAEQPVQAAAS
jgi:putative oxidoreductase